MHLHSEAWLPLAPDAVFPFFSDAANLQALTPAWLHFRIKTPLPVDMREGARIDYTIRVRGVPFRWETVITRWEPPHLFVDEQRRGPYRRWVHMHRFVGRDDGTLLTDDVAFDVPVSWLAGRFVARDVARVFEFRHRALFEAFGQPEPWPPSRIRISA